MTYELCMAKIRKGFVRTVRFDPESDHPVRRRESSVLSR